MLPAFVKRSFFDWLVPQAAENLLRDEPFKTKILDYLDVVSESVSVSANLIPRVPSVMVQLLKRSHEENISGSELNRIMTKHVVLLAAIRTEVNSLFYNMNSPVTELSQAIFLLGHNRLRIVLAKLSFRPVYNEQLGTFTKMTSGKIWEQWQQRALACYLLAKYQKINPFMAFLAGLMQDVDLVVALRVFDRSSSGDLPARAEFRNALEKKSMILSTRIGQPWSLPEIVIRAIEAQTIDQSALVKISIAKVLKKFDFISKTVTLLDAGFFTADMEKIRGILTAGS